MAIMSRPESPEGDGSEEKRLFLLDGMALVYRAHFAFMRRPIFNSKGMNTSAVMGFTNTLVDLIQNRKPTHIVVAFDTAAPTARHELYSDYKANREKMPEDLSAALPYIREVIEAFRIPVHVLDGYEADDIIGTLATRAAKEGFNTYMVTPDKDFGQLVNERVFMMRPAYRGDQAEIYGIREITERWGIERPDQVIDMLGLCGDASDNIPGVPKIGPKTAQKLIASYGTLENVLEHAHEVKGKVGERLVEFAEQARLSKNLATIDLEVPIEVSWDSLKISEPDAARLDSVLAEMEFRTLRRRLLGDVPGMAEGSVQAEMALFSSHRTAEDVSHRYVAVRTAEERRELLAKLGNTSAFCFDLETTSLDAKRAEIVGIAFSWEAHRGYFVFISREESAAREELGEFRDLFADPRAESPCERLVVPRRPRLQRLRLELELPALELPSRFSVAVQLPSQSVHSGRTSHSEVTSNPRSRSHSGPSPSESSASRTVSSTPSP